MPTWNDLVNEVEARTADDAAVWLNAEQIAALKSVSTLRGDRNVILYASAFLQKPAAPGSTLQLTHEEINGFMSVMYGMDWNKGLTLILHTPGGVTNAAETLVAYLWSKFQYLEVIIPTYAMSAGTMISLACDRIVMGRQSQLGPIDPQLPIGGLYVSARAIVEQFERAKSEILSDLTLAHVWAPILQSVGPALLQEAQNALEYGETMVAKWLAGRMFRGSTDAVQLAKATAAHFNDASKHKSHGRRIDREEARRNNVAIDDLEDSQELQEAVLTAYHIATILFEKGPATKFLVSDANRTWFKNIAP
jgi:hypothetical protein